MNYSELVKDFTLEQMVAINKVLDYLTKEGIKHRMTEQHLRALRIAGEVIEAEKFRAMMPEPLEQEQEQRAEPLTADDIEDIILSVEALENIRKTGCAYPEVMVSRTYPLSKE